MRDGRTLLIAGLGVVSFAAAQPQPSELTALTARAGLDRPVVAWCRGEFRAGHPGAFAVAATSAAGGGRYLVIESDATVTEVASFTGGPDLSCYSRAEAERLNDTISRSATIHGRLTPRWNTAVVCAFLDATTSECWQYSPAERRFVSIGGWVT